SIETSGTEINAIHTGTHGPCNLYIRQSRGSASIFCTGSRASSGVARPIRSLRRRRSEPPAFGPRQAFCVSKAPSHRGEWIFEVISEYKDRCLRKARGFAFNPKNFFCLRGPVCSGFRSGNSRYLRRFRPRATSLRISLKTWRGRSIPQEAAGAGNAVG